MSSTALTAISVAVGVFFVFFGTLKLGPLFSDELYRSVVNYFQEKTLLSLFNREKTSLGCSRRFHLVRLLGGIRILM